ncbi:MAG TPA: DUF2272 domain-containing protein [Stellaceae bacterium]|nr:DUF2272 domain-containing protein [Stellaceae bacterium]
MTSRVVAASLLVFLVAGCTSAQPPAPSIPRDIQIPPYAKKPYQPLSRAAAAQIALREWRAFGQKIILSPDQPENADSEERDEGLWQRVGDYWFQGLDYGSADSAWTGKHDQNGIEFPRGDDGDFAWSAAFIDYVMRMAGAGGRFPYAPAHSDYIDAARTRGDLAITALPVAGYAPQLGDIICMWRANHPVRFEDLPAGHFPGHCDIVVAQRPGTLDVVGGNVDNAVALKHVPTDPAGHVNDPDYPYFVVLKVAYQL